eukprot:GEMP01117634.1.p1 GENE.GEMP01117634.1~~GEMP01117634.1.p1  ORF type:complete len:121 (+),score=12.70 GEMP01117634.1:171-533(+)
MSNNLPCFHLEYFGRKKPHILAVIVRNRSLAEENLPDNPLYRKFERGPVIGQRAWQDVVEDLLKEHPKGLSWMELQEKCFTSTLKPATTGKDSDIVKLEILAAIPEAYLSETSNKVRRVV